MDFAPTIDRQPNQKPQPVQLGFVDYANTSSNELSEREREAVAQSAKELENQRAIA